MSKVPFDGRAPVVVGIGASAGGLTAFKQFFAKMPIQNGMAFVLVQHLDPLHKSLLVDLIAKQTKMKVVEAVDGAVLCADTVFVIPPDATLTVHGGVLHLVKPAPPRELRRPIDTFFLSLAEDQGENAVCIVLSGTGSDGTIGLKAVKQHGGLTLAQAEFDHQAQSGMPESAAATGLVDLVLPVDDMPARLMAHRAYLMDAGDHDDVDWTNSETAVHLKSIMAILCDVVGQDFEQYKESTVIRRVQRRMQVLQIGTVPEFIEHLKKDPHEVEELFREILIGVTAFFRDPLAFDALQVAVLPKLLAKKAVGAPIRIWVAGCANGEEVYSIAILLKEAMRELKHTPQVQIFGSDIDDRAIARARRGRFKGPLEGVSPERLSRWFTQEGSDFVVSRDIREMCIFSIHSLVKDPPFSKMDLVSCRNVMIYFDQDLQNRVIRNFHHALAPGGFLFLGSSEGLTRHAALFVAVDKKNRIFEWRRALETSPREFPLPSVSQHKQVSGSDSSEDPIERDARRIIAKYSPSYVVIDQNFHVVRFSGGGLARYLEPSPGVASLDLFVMLRKSLRTVVRSAIRMARSTQTVVVTESIDIAVEGQSRAVVVIVEPLSDAGSETSHFMVVFRDGESGIRFAGLPKPMGPGGARDSSASESDTEHELMMTKTSLRNAIDELETTTEEMKSSNEEYQSVNEELQAANEELETAREEMHSVNEELRSLNAEMTDKNEQLLRLNGDLRNLLDSTQIATIFLDNSLHIKSFTPGMVELIHLRESDQGRPITELVSRLNYADLELDVRNVLQNLNVIEREVRIGHDDTGSVLVMRVRPYRTVKDVVDGVVITFVDITARKILEDVLKESERRLSAIINQAAAGVAETDFDGRFTLSNPVFCRITGRTKTELAGMRMQDITHPDDKLEYSEKFAQLITDGKRFDLETRYVRPDRSVVWVHSSVSPTMNADGIVKRVLAVVLDTTDQKLAEAHRELLLHELSHRVKNTLATVQAIARQTSLGAKTVEDYRAAFLARLMALSRTHNLLQTADWHGALLRDIVLCELVPYQSDKQHWTVEGADVLLEPNTALAFGMAIHELATNAAKYGSLSNGDGNIAVRWSAPAQENGRALTFQWIESGGPVVSASRRAGFGTRLVTEGLALQMNATIDLDFKPLGVQCSIEVLLPPLATLL